MYWPGGDVGASQRMQERVFVGQALPLRFVMRQQHPGGPTGEEQRDAGDDDWQPERHESGFHGLMLRERKVFLPRRVSLAERAVRGERGVKARVDNHVRRSSPKSCDRGYIVSPARGRRGVGSASCVPRRFGRPARRRRRRFFGVPPGWASSGRERSPVTRPSSRPLRCGELGDAEFVFAAEVGDGLDHDDRSGSGGWMLGHVSSASRGWPMGCVLCFSARPNFVGNGSRIV